MAAKSPTIRSSHVCEICNFEFGHSVGLQLHLKTNHRNSTKSDSSNTYHKTTTVEKCLKERTGAKSEAKPVAKPITKTGAKPVEKIGAKRFAKAGAKSVATTGAKLFAKFDEKTRAKGKVNNTLNEIGSTLNTKFQHKSKSNSTTESFSSFSLAKNLHTHFSKQNLSIDQPRSENGDPEYVEPSNLLGLETPAKKLKLYSRDELYNFISEMIKKSTGKSSPLYNRPKSRPKWWPSSIPWGDISQGDSREPEEIDKMKWKKALRALITACYTFHGQQDLPNISKKINDEDYPTPNNPLGLEKPSLEFVMYTTKELCVFISEMITRSTGRSSPQYNTIKSKPQWWPISIPWSNINRGDIRKPGKIDILSWNEALRSVVTACYTFHGQQSLLTIPDAPEAPQDPLGLENLTKSLKMYSQEELKTLICTMLKRSTGRKIPKYRKPESRPQWWPNKIPWADINRGDIREPEEIANRSWNEALRGLITVCYTFHGQQDLLTIHETTNNPRDPLGLETPTKKLKMYTKKELLFFISEMIKRSTGRRLIRYNKPEARPRWWPKNIPWKRFTQGDSRSKKEKDKSSWNRALRSIVHACYSFHGQQDLLIIPTAINVIAEPMEIEIEQNNTDNTEGDEQMEFQVVESLKNEDGNVTSVLKPLMEHFSETPGFEADNIFEGGLVKHFSVSAK